MEDFNESLEIIDKYKEHFSEGDYVRICGLLKGFYDRIIKDDDYSEYSEYDNREDSEYDSMEESEEGSERDSMEDSILENEESPEMRFYDWIDCKCVGLRLCSNHNDILDCKNLEEVKRLVPTLNYYLNDNLVKQDFTIKDEIGLQSFKEIFGSLLDLLNSAPGRTNKIKLTLSLYEVVFKSKSAISNSLKESCLRKVEYFREEEESYYREISDKLNLSENILDIWERELSNFVIP